MIYNKQSTNRLARRYPFIS